MKDFLQLNGKHILVTGSGSGIGRQTAITLSEYGAKLSLIDLFEEKLGETLGMLSGSGHRAYAINLAEIDALEGKLKEIIAEQGAFDGYVQSAGINRDLPINSVKFEKLHDLMLVNFYSFYEIVRIISRKGRYNPGLSIVGISSTASVCGVSAQTAYSASKAAMNGTMRSMAKELGAKEIRVNTVLERPRDRVKGYFIFKRYRLPASGVGNVVALAAFAEAEAFIGEHGRVLRFHCEILRSLFG